MKRLLFGTLGALLVLGVVAGCVEDPTSGLRGDVVRVLISRTYVEIDVGDVQRLNAKAFDAQGNVVGILPEIAVSDESVVSYVIDDTTSGDPLPQTDFQITGVADGSTTITATAGGVTSDPIDVVVFPPDFEGTVTLDATGSIDVLTLSATALVKFTDSSQVLVDDESTVLISRTADEMQVAVPWTRASPRTGAVVTVEDLVFSPPHTTYDIASLDAPATFDIRTGFPGTVVLDASGAVDLLTISATSDLKFDATTSSTVLINDDATVLLSRTADLIEVAVISAEDLDSATVTITDLQLMYGGAQYEMGDLNSATKVDIRTTLFDGAIAVDASEQADHITLTASANFEFADDAEVLVDGDPTFPVSNSGTELVVAAGNIDAVTAGEITIENALYVGLYDVASVVAAATVDLEAFDNSVTITTNDPATAPDITPGSFPYVYYTLITHDDPDQFVKLTGALDVTATFDWVTGADVDLLWCDDACANYVGNFNGATGANPEESSVSIPAATTWNLWTNLYSGDDSVIRVTLTSP